MPAAEARWLCQHSLRVLFSAGTADLQRMCQAAQQPTRTQRGQQGKHAEALSPAAESDAYALAEVIDHQATALRGMLCLADDRGWFRGLVASAEGCPPGKQEGWVAAAAQALRVLDFERGAAGGCTRLGSWVHGALLDGAWTLACYLLHDMACQQASG